MGTFILEEGSWRLWHLQAVHLLCSISAGLWWAFLVNYEWVPIFHLEWFVKKIYIVVMVKRAWSGVRKFYWDGEKLDRRLTRMKFFFCIWKKYLLERRHHSISRSTYIDKKWSHMQVYHARFLCPGARYPSMRFTTNLVNLLVHPLQSVCWQSTFSVLRLWKPVWS